MKKHNGMTLVSVIVGFAILLIGISMFYGTIQISNNILSTQKERTEQTEQLINQYYKKSNGAQSTETSLTMKEGSSNIPGLDSITVKKYKITINNAGELYYYGK